MRSMGPLTLAALIVSFMALPALAGKKEAQAAPEEPQAKNLMSILGGLKWGDTKEAVLEQNRKSVYERFQKQIEEAEDPMVQDKLRAKAREEHEEFAGTYHEFKGNDASFKASIVGKQFESGTGEAVLVRKIATAQQYYFFAGGKLWKFFVTYDAESNKNIDFPTFVSRLQANYGNPSSVDYEVDDRDDYPRATWDDGATRLEVADRSDFFGIGAYTMLFEDKSVASRINDIRGARGASSGGGLPSSTFESMGGQDKAAPVKVDDFNF